MPGFNHKAKQRDTNLTVGNPAFENELDGNTPTGRGYTIPMATGPGGKKVWNSGMVYSESDDTALQYASTSAVRGGANAPGGGGSSSSSSGGGAAPGLPPATYNQSLASAASASSKQQTLRLARYENMEQDGGETYEEVDDAIPPPAPDKARAGASSTSSSRKVVRQKKTAVRVQQPVRELDGTIRYGTGSTGASATTLSKQLELINRNKLESWKTKGLVALGAVVIIALIIAIAAVAKAGSNGKQVDLVVAEVLASGESSTDNSTLTLRGRIQELEAELEELRQPTSKYPPSPLQKPFEVDSRGPCYVVPRPSSDEGLLIAPDGVPVGVVSSGGVFLGSLVYAGEKSEVWKKAFREANVAVINGDLTIQGCAITGSGACDDLSVFDGITTITGTLTVAGNGDGLTTLENALPGLQSVGEKVVVASNHQLTSLGSSALASLTTVANAVEITNNDGLVELESAFASLLRTGDLTITGNNLLVGVGGTAFPILATATGVVSFSNNAVLSKLEGTLQALESAGSLLVVNTKVKAINGTAFAKLAACSSEIKVTGNSKLVQLSLPALQTAQGGISVTSNPALVEVSWPQLASAEGIISVSTSGATAAKAGGITVGSNNVELVVTFPQLRSAGGVSIASYSAVSSLNGTMFPKLASSSGTIQITSNANLKSMSRAFPALILAAGILVESNANLANLDGTAFEKLDTADAAITIRGNSKLASLAGAFPLLVTADRIDVSSNSVLASLSSAFASLTLTQTISITNNNSPQFTAFGAGAFAKLATCNVSLAVSSNSYLDTFDLFFRSLDTVGSIAMSANGESSGSQITFSSTFFPKLQVATGVIDINSHSYLYYIDSAFPLLVKCAGIKLRSNSNLKTLNSASFAKLANSTGTVEISSCSNFESTSGLFPALVETAGIRLSGLSDSSFTSLSGSFQALTVSTGEIYFGSLSYFHVFSSIFPSLERAGGITITSCGTSRNEWSFSNAFTRLTTLTGLLAVENNYYMRTLSSGFPALAEAAGIRVASNGGSSTTFYAMDSKTFPRLKKNDGILHVYANPYLHQFGSYPFFPMLEETGAIVMHSNGNSQGSQQYFNANFFPKLKKATGLIDIYSNSYLQYMNGAFPALTDCAGVRIRSNSGFQYMQNAFTRLRNSTGVIEMSAMSVFHAQSYAIFPALEVAGGVVFNNLHDSSNRYLASGSFAKLKSVSGPVQFYQMNHFYRFGINSFQSLESAGSLEIRYCTASTDSWSVSGAFPKLQTVAGLLRIEDNDYMDTLENAFPLLEEAGSVIIRYNGDSGRDFVTMGAATFPKLTTITGMLHVSDHYNLYDYGGGSTPFFKALEKVGGITMHTNGNSNGNSITFTTNFFPKLKESTGLIDIYSLTYLYYMNGAFPALEKSAGIKIRSNSHFKYMNGAFPKLRNATGNIEFTDSSDFHIPFLIFPALEVAGGVKFHNNNENSFTSIPPGSFANLIEVGLIEISGCSYFNTLSTNTFPVLKRIGTLNIYNNDNLNSLGNSFAQVEEIETLYFYANPAGNSESTQRPFCNSAKRLCSLAENTDRTDSGWDLDSTRCCSEE